MASRLLLSVCLSLVFLPLSAQNNLDALRYSLLDINGSARVQAMGGAFSALGGDVSSIGINPAASAVFLDSQGSFGFGLNTQNNAQSYFGDVTNSRDHHLGLIHAGGVLVAENAQIDSPWRKVSFGFNVNRQSDLTGEFITSGVSQTSIGNFFQEQAQGIPLSDLQLYSGESISSVYRYLGETQGTDAQNAFLGYQGYIIDPLIEDPTNTAYNTTAGPGGLRQDFTEYNRGEIQKYSLNLGTQYGQSLYLGINFNSHTLNFRSQTQFREFALNPNNTNQALVFENNLGVNGEGFSLQLGAIYLLPKRWRLSFTYDSPTWWNITEETAQYLQTNRLINNENVVTTVNPEILNVFDTYQLRTPGKIGAGLAYVFKQHGVLSLEYGQKNYANAALGPRSYTFYAAENKKIEQHFRNATMLKMGGEYRWNVWRLRGGLWHEQSPLKTSRNVGDYIGQSMGIGYSYGLMTIDLTYLRAERKREQVLFVEQNQISKQQINNVMMCSITLSL
jgi:hypothetical protein